MRGVQCLPRAATVLALASVVHAAAALTLINSTLASNTTFATTTSLTSTISATSSLTTTSLTSTIITTTTTTITKGATRVERALEVKTVARGDISLKTMEEVFQKAIAAALDVPITFLVELSAFELKQGSRLRRLQDLQARWYEIEYVVMVPSHMDSDSVVETANRIAERGSVESLIFQDTLTATDGIVKVYKVALSITGDNMKIKLLGAWHFGTNRYVVSTQETFASSDLLIAGVVNGLSVRGKLVKEDRFLVATLESDQGNYYGEVRIHMERGDFIGCFEVVGSLTANCVVAAREVISTTGAVPEATFSTATTTTTPTPCRPQGDALCSTATATTTPLETIPSATLIRTSTTTTMTRTARPTARPMSGLVHAPSAPTDDDDMPLSPMIIVVGVLGLLLLNGLPLGVCLCKRRQRQKAAEKKQREDEETALREADEKNAAEIAEGMRQKAKEEIAAQLREQREQEEAEAKRKAEWQEWKAREAIEREESEAEKKRQAEAEAEKRETIELTLARKRAEAEAEKREVEELARKKADAEARRREEEVERRRLEEQVVAIRELDRKRKSKKLKEPPWICCTTGTGEEIPDGEVPLDVMLSL